MTVRQNQIEIAIVIEIEEPQPPAGIHIGVLADTGGSGHVAERESSQISIQGKPLPIEVGDKQVQFAIAIVVSGIHAHSAARNTIVRVSDAGLQSEFLEA